MTAYDFDLFVIGGGSGGVRAARIAAGYGARVALAEEYRLGGTCVIRGCVPKKLLVYASRFRDDFEDAAGFGWRLSGHSFDWPALIAAKDKEIARLEALYRATLERAGVTLLGERARVSGPHAATLASGMTVTAGTILLATGGAPNIDPHLPGREHVITSNEALDLPALPQRVVVAGGGYIAVEFASIFNGLGSDTTLVYRGDKPLRGFDEDLRDGLVAAMGRRGIKFVFGDVFAKIERAGEQYRATLRNTGATLEADQILFAIGRSPNTAGLGLDEAGVALRENGSVVVDADGRSTVPSIFAVGDVTDRVNLTPVAIREGHAFADAQFGKGARPLDYEFIPTAVFSTPEIGSVGLAEHAAREQYDDVHIYRSQFRPMRNVLGARDERTIMKLVVDARSARMLGVHVLGPDAAEIVQMAAIALRLGATKADFDQTMALHPSAAEELVTMRERWVAPAEAPG